MMRRGEVEKEGYRVDAVRVVLICGVEDHRLRAGGADGDGQGCDGISRQRLEGHGEPRSLKVTCWKRD